jgi:hypothetical protein
MTIDERNQLIEQYLDGALTGEHLAAFEARLRTEPEMADSVHRQREINASLLRRLAVPSPDIGRQILARIESETARSNVVGAIAPMPKRPAVPRWLAVAAVIAIVIGGTWAIWMNMQPGSSGVSPMLLDPVAYYKRKTESGFQPVWKCDTDHEFAKYFADRYGQPVLLRPMPEDVSCAGIDYTTVLSGDTASLLMHDGPNRIVVLLDHAANDRAMDLPASSGLHKFRRDVGQYVAYEITPLDSPHILDLLYVPDRIPDMPPGTQSAPEVNGESPQTG